MTIAIENEKCLEDKEEMVEERINFKEEIEIDMDIEFMDK